MRGVGDAANTQQKGYIPSLSGRAEPSAFTRIYFLVVKITTLEYDHTACRESYGFLLYSEDEIPQMKT